MPVLPTVSDPNARKLASSLKVLADGVLGKPVSLLPLNFRRPDDTTWWLCPGPDVPAHHYGKYAVRPADSCGDLFVGISFEKGLNVPGRDRGTGRKRILNSEWVWNAFFDRLQNGTFDEYAVKAQHAAGIPVNVVLSARIMNPDTDFEERLARLPDQRTYYSFDSSRLSLIDEHSESASLIRASDCCALMEIALRINEAEDIDWMMINIEVGFLLAIGDDGGPRWSTDTIWSNACEPFLDWFRQSA